MPGHDSYPLAAVPTLAVRDAVRSARWYRERLGFHLVHERPGLNGTPVLVHLRRGPHQDVMLATAGRPVRPAGVTLTFWVDDLEQLTGGAEPGGELTVVDPDGHQLVFQRRRPGR
jgi:catechol 2,3-dioxygenase-like lactoylglutathione lyase family enzyme